MKELIEFLPIEVKTNSCLLCRKLQSEKSTLRVEGKTIMTLTLKKTVGIVEGSLLDDNMKELIELELWK